MGFCSWLQAAQTNRGRMTRTKGRENNTKSEVRTIKRTSTQTTLIIKHTHTNAHTYTIYSSVQFDFTCIFSISLSKRLSASFKHRIFIALKQLKGYTGHCSRTYVSIIYFGVSISMFIDYTCAIAAAIKLG